MIIDYWQLSEENRDRCLKGLKQCVKSRLEYLTNGIESIDAIESVYKQATSPGYVCAIMKEKEAECAENDSDALDRIVSSYNWIDKSTVEEALAGSPDNPYFRILACISEIACINKEVAVVTFYAHDEENFFYSGYLDAIVLNVPLQMEYTQINIEAKKTEIANRAFVESCYSL